MNDLKNKLRHKWARGMFPDKILQSWPRQCNLAASFALLFFVVYLEIRILKYSSCYLPWPSSRDSKVLFLGCCDLPNLSFREIRFTASTTTCNANVTSKQTSSNSLSIKKYRRPNNRNPSKILPNNTVQLQNNVHRIQFLINLTKTFNIPCLKLILDQH